MAKSNVSIVIPTLNSAETLDRCLSSIKANTTRYQYEIIVVDAESADETRDISQKYADKVIVKKNCPPGEARNIGIENARGYIICFTDSDCIVPQNWINDLVDALMRLSKNDTKIVGVGGGNIPLTEQASLIELATSKVVRSPLVSFRARNVATDEYEHETIHIPPLNSAYFKSVLKEVGAFGAEQDVAEDLELDAKIAERGYKLYYLPKPIVYHKHKTNIKGFVKQMYDFGGKRIRVGRKYRRFLQFQHYGPIFLCVMTLSPLFFIPLGMALVNASYLTFKEKKLLLFFPALILTLSFYVSYGAGEIKALLKEH